MSFKFMTDGFIGTEYISPLEQHKTPKQTTVRGEVLLEGKELTEGDRNKAYGSPYENLSNHAALATSYLIAAKVLPHGSKLYANHMAEIMNLGKIARRAVNPLHRDSYVDGAAYTAIGFETANEEYGGHVNG
jgi:hypothetical protein